MAENEGILFLSSTVVLVAVKEEDEDEVEVEVENGEGRGDEFEAIPNIFKWE